jgi:L-ascorbate metabolism protein UlaG (beta-lactamase superfamily)
MEITYLGHSCFKLKNKQGVVIIDPYSEKTGPTLGRQTADVVVSSHAHDDHSAVERIKGSSEGEQPIIITHPGEYEVKGISIFGIEAYHDNQEGKVRGEDIIFVMVMDNVSVCHLGDLGQEKLSEEQIERIGEVDVLLCPVGGHYTLDAKGAIAVMNQLEPKIFVPMHYRTPRHNLELFGQIATLESFNNEYGIDPTPVKKLELTKERLPEETEVVVFE